MQPPYAHLKASREDLVYDILAHTKKIPACIFMFDALIIYAPIRAALERALAETAIACGEEQVFLCAALEEKEDVDPKLPKRTKHHGTEEESLEPFI